MQVLEHQKDRTLGLVFRQHANQEAFRNVVLPGIELGKDVHPAEGEDASLGLPYAGTDVRHGYQEGHQLVLVVHHKGHQVFVHDGRILPYIVVNLLLGKLGVLVEGVEGGIEHMEHLLAPADHLPVCSGPIDMYAEAFFHQVRILVHGRQLAVKVHVALGPVGIFGKAHPLQVLRIVGIVIDDRKGAFALEALYQQAFAVHVRKAQGALDMCGSAFGAPDHDGLDESLGHLEVFDEVYPSETDGNLAEFLVGLVVDDGGYAPHNLIVLISQIEFPFTEIQGRIPVSQGLEFVILEGRNPVFTIFVKVQGKVDKSLEHLLVLDGNNGGNRFHFHVIILQIYAFIPNYSNLSLFSLRSVFAQARPIFVGINLSVSLYIGIVVLLVKTVFAYCEN